jgi:hypothetical protein
MKTILILVVLGSVFLFGYDLGRTQNSPDVVGWLKTTSREAYAIGEDVIAAVSEKTKSMASSEEYSQ